MELTTEQIQILLVEKMAGTIEEQDSQTLQQLLDSNPEVRRQWIEMQQQLGKIGGLPSSAGEEEAWQKVQQGLRPRTIPMLRKSMAAAAVILVAAGGFYLFRKEQNLPASPSRPVITFSIGNQKSIPIESPQIIQAGPVKLQADQQQMTLPATAATSLQWSTLAVPPTLDYKITLSDGTEVRLNSQTTLRFPLGFQGPKREVYVQGEAWFKVSKDKLHPFIVHTPATEVLVVGTQFDVNTYEDKEETALVEGAVILKHEGSEVAIKPGIKSVYTPGRGFSTSSFDSTEQLSWMRGVYYFHNTPLKDLAKLIARWYNVEVRFVNPSLQSKTFSGQIVKGQPLQSFLDNLNLSEDMHGSLRDGKIIF